MGDGDDLDQISKCFEKRPVEYGVLMFDERECNIGLYENLFKGNF